MQRYPKKMKKNNIKIKKNNSTPNKVLECEK